MMHLQSFRRQSLCVLCAVLLSLPLVNTVQANDSLDPIEQISAQWQQIAFNTPANEQASGYANLNQALEQALSQQAQPEAELLTWAGIVNASHAGAKGGLGALKLAKLAKAQLEQALAINPNAGNGGAMTTLGTLYEKVPGWPLGFGSAKKAQALLQQSAEQHPDQLVPQYFWGEFLYHNQQKKAAQAVFSHAITLKPRAQAKLADQARIEQMRQRLASLSSAP